MLSADECGEELGDIGPVIVEDVLVLVYDIESTLQLVVRGRGAQALQKLWDNLKEEKKGWKNPDLHRFIPKHHLFVSEWLRPTENLHKQSLSVISNVVIL